MWSTIVLGSTTLLEPEDAVMLIGRLFRSTVVSRIISMFELAGSRETITPREMVT
jgi:hypothetical protein